MKTWSDLSTEQLTFVARQLERTGVDPGQLPERLSGGGDDVLASPSDPATTVSSQRLVVGSVDELKEICGVPNQRYIKGGSDDFIDYPGPLGSDAPHLGGSGGVAVSDPEREAILRAARAYVLGNSRRVESFREIIDALFFPLSVARYVARNWHIRAGEVKTVREPALICVGALAIEQGGQLRVEASCQMTAGLLQLAPPESPAKNDPGVPAILLSGGIGPDAESGPDLYCRTHTLSGAIAVKVSGGTDSYRYIVADYRRADGAARFDLAPLPGASVHQIPS